MPVGENRRVGNQIDDRIVGNGTLTGAMATAVTAL